MNANNIQHENPLVSVLMTCYNREKFVGEAIESVLRSDYKNFELIIVDDGSVDNTILIAEKYAHEDVRIKFYQNENNLGDYHNRNKAASYATGKYIVYLDSDDLMYDFAIGFGVRFMEMFPQAGFGMSSFYDKKAPYPVCISPGEIYYEHFFLKFGHFSRSPASAIIRLDVFNALQGFSGKRYVGDLEFWTKISRYYKMVKYATPNFWYRTEHEGKESVYEGSNFAKLRRKILMDALQHPDCPLKKTDVQILMKRLNRSRYHNLLISLSQKVINRIR